MLCSIETVQELCGPAPDAPESFTKRQEGEQTIERAVNVSDDGSCFIDAALRVQVQQRWEGATCGLTGRSCHPVQLPPFFVIAATEPEGETGGEDARHCDPAEGGQGRLEGDQPSSVS